MYENTIHEEIHSNDGNYRAVIRTDFDGRAPDGDYFGSVLVGDMGDHRTVAQSYPATRRGVDFADTLDALWADLRDMGEVEGVLRGTMNICEECGLVMTGYDETTECEGDEDGWHLKAWDFSEDPIVGFDYFDTRQGDKVINIVTLSDLKLWGFYSLEAYQKANPGLDPSAHNLDEFREWVDGAVYWVDLEQKMIEETNVHTMSSWATQTPINTYVTETWESTGELACGGFYGAESALEYAKEIIDNVNEEETA